MATFTRRTFFRRASLATAAVGALAAAPHLLESHATPAGAAAHSLTASPGSTTTATLAGSSNEPIVAYVRDAAKGEIVLMAGTREIVRHDPELVSRLLHLGV